MSNLPVRRLLFWQVGVEEDDRCAPAHVTGHDVQPSTDPHRSVFDAQRNLRVQPARPARRIPDIRMFRLRAISADLLPKVAGAADQRYAHQRQRQIGRSTQRVAGEHSQATGIGWNLASQRDLHREVGDARLLDTLIDHSERFLTLRAA